MPLIVVILIVLWFAGYGPLEAFRVTLFHLMGRAISLWDILIFLLIIYLIDTLPSPIREIVIIFLIVWLASVAGFISIAGFNNLLLIALIAGLLLYAIKK